MAQRSRPVRGRTNSNGHIENLASEVGRLFGSTEAHARRWLNQRADQ